MYRNVGSADRIFRIIAAIIIFALIFTDAVEGSAALILGVLAAILAVTAFISTCPIYMALGLSTRKEVKKV